MNKFAVVIPYFGTFPNYFNFWIASASYNNFIDWYIITDNKYLGKTPENIHFILTTFNDLKNKIQKLYSFEIKMEKPYKLCDYKPAYGEIFDDIIKDYEFWGYGDLDVIYGDLRKFIPFDNLDNYDRIFSCGHLTLLRNTKIITSLYRKKIQGLEYFQDAFSHSDGFTFDEWGQPSRGGGYYQICERSDIRIFNEISFADICIKYNRLVNNFGGDKFEVKEEEAKKFVCFLFKNGCLYKQWGRKKVFMKEVSYIHLQKRHMKINTNNENIFYINGHSFDDRRTFYNFGLNYLYIKFCVGRIIYKLKQKGT